MTTMRYLTGWRYSIRATSEPYNIRIEEIVPSSSSCLVLNMHVYLCYLAAMSDSRVSAVKFRTKVGGFQDTPKALDPCLPISRIVISRQFFLSFSSIPILVLPEFQRIDRIWWTGFRAGIIISSALWTHNDKCPVLLLNGPFALGWHTVGSCFIVKLLKLSEPGPGSSPNALFVRLPRRWFGREVTQLMKRLRDAQIWRSNEIEEAA